MPFSFTDGRDPFIAFRHELADYCCWGATYSSLIANDVAVESPPKVLDSAVKLGRNHGERN
ncbi:hypothetical protein OCQ_27690 [Mycobacterium paraintracellulare]|nr:hypothetical protein OCQ_27690 [Mycobacterium paraintracellulare]